MALSRRQQLLMDTIFPLICDELACGTPGQMSGGRPYSFDYGDGAYHGDGNGSNTDGRPALVPGRHYPDTGDGWVWYGDQHGDGNGDGYKNS